VHRHTCSSFDRQIPLALNPGPGTTSEQTLREAYRRLDLARRLSFEQAMSVPAFAIGIRNLADAQARREYHKASGEPRRRAPQ
jgi:hypothetical protein